DLGGQREGDRHEPRPDGGPGARDDAGRSLCVRRAARGRRVAREGGDMTRKTVTPAQSLVMLLRALKLPSFTRYAEEVAQKAEREGWTFGQYLHHLAELEVQERHRRRIERYQKNSELPAEKALATLDRTKV